MPVWLIVILVIVAVIIGIPVLFAILSWRYMGRCLVLMRTDRFLTPCEIASAHFHAHGFFGNWEFDQSVLHLILPKMERDGLLIGKDHDPKGECACTRTYCLSASPNRASRQLKNVLTWFS